MKPKLSWLEIALLVAPFLALVISWNDLPARVPVHWNLHGEIDGWGAKTPGLLLLPLSALGVVALLRLLPRLDPKLRSASPEQGRMPAVLPILRLALAAFFTIVFFALFAAALGQAIAIPRIVLGSVLLLFAVMGNYLANLRPNYFIGIRTPWTLESPETWRATHRLSGRLMFFSSLLLLPLQFFLALTTWGFLVLASNLLLVAWAIWYSWHHFHIHAATTR